MKSIATPSSKTGAVLADEGGDPLMVRSAAVGAAFLLETSGDVLRFANEHAPALALAILTAAGVQPHTGTALVRGDRRDMWAVRYLMDHVEAQAEDAAEKELTRRRDALSLELDGDMDTYVSTCAGVRRAIDMIIRLQDEAAK